MSGSHFIDSIFNRAGRKRVEAVVPIVKLEREAGKAIKSFLADKGIRLPLRIDLHSTGCCDASLYLCADSVREGDLTTEVDSVTFVISPETYELTGEVTIGYVDEAGKKGFIITSGKSINEWDGFGVCDIKI